jgi:hypothetical protein
VNGSRGVSRGVIAVHAKHDEVAGPSAASGDAVTRASMGSNVHASHRSSDAALSPQSRCACPLALAFSRAEQDGNAVAATEDFAFPAVSGGFRERRRRPTTLGPATSHAPRSHVVVAILEIARERQ